VLTLAMITFQLVVVQGLKQVGSAGLAVTFHTKQTATLRADHRNYEYYERLLRRSLERKRPVAASVSNGEVQQVIRADQDVVRDLVEDGPTRAKVWFAGHDGIYHIDRSDPQAKRVYDALAKSRRTEGWVWFAATIPDLLIVDALSEDELPFNWGPQAGHACPPSFGYLSFDSHL